MFCDDVIEHVNGGSALARLRSIVPPLINDRLSDLRVVIEIGRPETVRLSLDTSAMALVTDLTRDIETLLASRSDLRLPYDRFWIEYAKDGGHVGMLVERDQADRRAGSVQVVMRRPSAHIEIASMLFDLDNANVAWGLDPDRDHVVEASRFQGQVSGVLMALCAVMSTPRLVDRVEPDLGRLNAARAKRRKAPLLDHSVVRLTRTAAAAHQATQPDRTAPDGSKRRFHHVRAFVRVRRGKVEFVRPHTRGDRDVGVLSSIRVTGGVSAQKGV